MIGGLVLWLVGKGLSERMARVVAIGGLFLLAAALVVGVVSCIRGDAVEDHEGKIERRAKPATDQAASERAKDEIEAAKKHEERRDVIEAQPDQPIAPTSRALACKRLHDAGRDPPACR